MLLTQIFTVLKDRPTYLWQYMRGTLHFLRCKALSPLFLNKKKVLLGSNVRFQSLTNFLAASPESSISVGADSVIYEHARLEAYGSGNISVGASSILGDTRIVSRAKITLGARTLTSWNVMIQDFDPHPLSQELRAQQVEKMAQDFFPRWTGKTSLTAINWQAPTQEIWMGDDVWLGAQSIILKGTRIGSGSIVAAGSVVTGGDFPERSLIAGNPARWIKELPL